MCCKKYPNVVRKHFRHIEKPNALTISDLGTLYKYGKGIVAMVHKHHYKKVCTHNMHYLMYGREMISENNSRYNSMRESKYLSLCCVTFNRTHYILENCIFKYTTVLLDRSFSINYNKCLCFIKALSNYELKKKIECPDDVVENINDFAELKKRKL